MQVDKILELIGVKEESGIQGASLPAALVERMLQTNARLNKENSKKETMNEVFCRLLASGMPAAEIAVILRVRTDAVDEAEQYGREKIAVYAKQLKGRRRSAEGRRNGGV
jgi:hypothetical protein